jgi:hypothetical protein
MNTLQYSEKFGIPEEEIPKGKRGASGRRLDISAVVKTIESEFESLTPESSIFSLPPVTWTVVKTLRDEYPQYIGKVGAKILKATDKHSTQFLLFRRF